MASTSSFTASRWLVSRLVPCVLLVLVGGVAIGMVRGLVLFVPGIMGMIAGGLSGWLCGRLGRGDSSETWSFTNRSWLALGAGLLYAVSAAATVSVLNAGTMGLPLDWLSDTIAGRGGEVFTGFSTNSWQSTSGDISGGWWFTFVILDGLLFTFLFHVMTMVGWGGGGKANDEVAVPKPVVPPRGLVPLAFVSFGGQVLAAAGFLALLFFWPAFTISSPTVSPSELVFEVEGDWAFGAEASFIGATEEARAFTLMPGLGSELAGFSVVPATFMLSLEPRRDGVFEGRLHLGGGGVFKTRMRVSKDRSHLDFVIERVGRASLTEIHLSACRRVASSAP